MLEFASASDASPPPNIDELDHRFALMASLRPDWDGSGSLAPPRAVLQVVYAAIDRLDDAAKRTALELSGHADGYVAITLKHGGRVWYADVYEDHTEYELDGEGWDGATNPDALQAFLQND